MAEEKKISLDDKIINWVSFNLFYSFLILILIIVLVLVSVFGITALIYEDKTILNPNEIGDTISGITAPIIGLFSAFLVYIAFREQIKANQKLEEQNQHILFDKHSTLIDKLNEQLNLIKYKSGVMFSGKDAIRMFLKNNLYNDEENNNKLFLDKTESIISLYKITTEQLNYIIDSKKFNSFEKNFLKYKLNEFYIDFDCSESDNANNHLIVAVLATSGVRDTSFYEEGYEKINELKKNIQCFKTKFDTILN